MICTRRRSASDVSVAGDVFIVDDVSVADDIFSVDDVSAVGDVFIVDDVSADDDDVSIVVDVFLAASDATGNFVSEIVDHDSDRSGTKQIALQC